MKHLGALHWLVGPWRKGAVSSLFFWNCKQLHPPPPLPSPSQLF